MLKKKKKIIRNIQNLNLLKYSKLAGMAPKRCVRRNMSTKTPEFSSNIGSSSQTPSYNFYGDIDLPNVQDPSNFMSELMSATDNRINVTKNKKL